MSGRKPSYEELEKRLERAEAVLDSLRRGEVDLVMGADGPLVVRVKSLVEENERLAREWQTTFDATNDAIWVLDSDHRILRSNRTAERFFGKAREEFIGRRCWEIVHATDAPIPECPILRARHSLRRESMGMPIGDRWFEVTVDPILDGDGNHAGAVHIVSDTTERKRVESLLQESCAKYETIFEATGTATMLVEEDFTIVAANRQCLPTTGYSPEELLGTKWPRYVAPESLELMLKYHKLRRAEPGQAPRSYEVKLVNKKGEIRDAILNIAMIPGTKRSVVSMMDITERKQAVEALRESEALFRALFHDHAAVKLLIDPQDGRIVDANNAAAEFYGWPREQLLNMKVQDINTLPSEEIKKNIELVRSGERGYFELRHRLADGTIRDVAVLSGRIDVKGEPFLHSIVHDISKRKQGEVEIRRLQTAIEQGGEAIVVTDTTGAIEYVNAAFEQLTGYSRDEALGRTPRLLKSGEQDEAFYRDLWETITNGRTWRGRMVNRHKDGSLYTEESTISPIHDTAGKIINYMAVKRDITEHLRVTRENALLEEQLRQAQKLESVGRLAGGVAHDFNNMLGIILGYGEILMQKLHPGDPLRDDVKQIVEAGKRSAALTRQLLAFSRKQTLQPKVLSLNDLLHNLEKMLRRLIGEDIDFQMELADDLGLVSIDPGQFDQIIMNLAVNARDAMPTGGKLIIETTNVDIDELYAKIHTGARPGKYVMISMTDSGCGMDETVLAHIFEPFFTTKEKERGTGLGLATVYGIIKQSGGNIWAYSEPGQGTTFKIYLPRTDAKPRAREIYPEEEGEIGGGRRVLVVEDEEAMRGLLRAILSRLGFQVFLAANGGEALLLVEEQGLKPDLLITDVVMPGMSGAVLAKRLRGSQPDLKVLFMSGYTDNAIVHHGVLDPASPFIQKPFSIKDIAEKIQRVLKGAITGSLASLEP